MNPDKSRRETSLKSRTCRSNELRDQNKHIKAHKVVSWINLEVHLVNDSRLSSERLCLKQSWVIWVMVNLSLSQWRLLPVMTSSLANENTLQASRVFLDMKIHILNRQDCLHVRVVVYFCRFAPKIFFQRKFPLCFFSKIHLNCLCFRKLVA